MLPNSNFETFFSKKFKSIWYVLKQSSRKDSWCLIWSVFIFLYSAFAIVSVFVSWMKLEWEPIVESGLKKKETFNLGHHQRETNMICNCLSIFCFCPCPCLCLKDEVGVGANCWEWTEGRHCLTWPSCLRRPWTWASKHQGTFFENQIELINASLQTGYDFF